MHSLQIHNTSSNMGPTVHFKQKGRKKVSEENFPLQISRNNMETTSYMEGIGTDQTIHVIKN